MTLIATIPVQKTMNINLTDEEAQGLVTLFDAACKAGGMQAALIAVPLFHKLQAAANTPEKEPE